MVVWLSPHFSLEELSATQHRTIDNRPPPAVVAALTETAGEMEAVRKLLGDRVIRVSSGYRCPELNLAVGGSAHSAHTIGRAVDFTCDSFGDPLQICRRLAGSSLAFDQIIQEHQWVHLSFDRRRRRQVLTRSGAGTYRIGVEP